MHEVVKRNELGELHSDDGPAIITPPGTEIWYHIDKDPNNESSFIAENSAIWAICGKYHRDDGPAIIHGDGGKEYWLHGVQLELSSAAYLIIKEKERRKACERNRP